MNIPSQKIQALVFDLDGVLIDSETLHEDVLVSFAAERGCTVTEAM